MIELNNEKGSSDLIIYVYNVMVVMYTPTSIF